MVFHVAEDSTFATRSWNEASQALALGKRGFEPEIFKNQRDVFAFLAGDAANDLILELRESFRSRIRFVIQDISFHSLRRARD